MRSLQPSIPLVKTKWNEFYLCIPEDIPPASISIPRNNAISLDPGVRTFLTGYDPSGQIVEIGKQDANTIFLMCLQADKTMAKAAKAGTHKQRYRRKRAAARVRQRIQDKIKDLHRKAAKFLCESYDTIFLPLFATKQMVRKATRKINSKTARSLLTFGHYAFRQTLQHKARSYANVRIHIVNESYTSKTCTRCGIIKNNLGGSKVFRCNSCGLCIDRDISGARNIYIRSVEAIGLPVVFGA
jgi:putative transposase